MLMLQGLLWMHLSGSTAWLFEVARNNLNEHHYHSSYHSRVTQIVSVCGLPEQLVSDN